MGHSEESEMFIFRIIFWEIIVNPASLSASLKLLTKVLIISPIERLAGPPDEKQAIILLTEHTKCATYSVTNTTI